MSGLLPKQRAFIEAYLSCWNATEAARQCGYKHPNKQGPRLLVNVGIRDAIEKRLAENAIGANETLSRLADIGRGDMGDFLDISSMGFQVDLTDAKDKGLTKLIKKVKQRTTTTLMKDGTETETHDIEIELYSALDALGQIGRHHKLFTDQTDVTSGGKVIQVVIGRKDDEPA